MRVLFLTPAAGFGGAERALVQSLKAVRQCEPTWTLGLLALEDGPALDAARSLGVDVMVSPPPGRFLETGESGRGRGGTLGGLLAAAPALARYAATLGRRIAAWRPMIVHSNGIKTHVLGAWVRGGAPLVWHVHDYLSLRNLSPRILRLHRRSAALVIANSRSVAEDANRVFGGTDVATVYNAIDFDRFQDTGPCLDLDAASDMPSSARSVVRVGLVATYARWKGHEVFLQALSALPPDVPVRGYVVGGPVYRSGPSQWTRGELDALAAAGGLDRRVGFTGFVDEPGAAYRSLDIVVHASTAPEPFGLSIAEAMACGRATIISDAGGTREIGQPETTCLAHAPGDAAGLGRQIERLARDASLRARLGAAAAISVRARFTDAQHVATLRAAYGALVAGHARS